MRDMQDMSRDVRGALQRLRERVAAMPPEEPKGDPLSQDERYRRQQACRVPPLYWGAKLSDWTPADYDPRCEPQWLWHADGPIPRSVFISGANGTGKTRLAAALVGEWGGLWRTALDIIMEVQATWRRGADDTEQGVIGYYRRTGLLVLDDLTAIANTERGWAVMLAILSGRCDRMLPTIVTSFLGTAAIEHSDSSMASRLGGFAQLRLIGDDRRIK